MPNERALAKSDRRKARPLLTLVRGLKAGTSKIDDKQAYSILRQRCDLAVQRAMGSVKPTVCDLSRAPGGRRSARVLVVNYQPVDSAVGPRGERRKMPGGLGRRGQGLRDTSRIMISSSDDNAHA